MNRYKVMIKFAGGGYYDTVVRADDVDQAFVKAYGELDLLPGYFVVEAIGFDACLLGD